MPQTIGKLCELLKLQWRKIKSTDPIWTNLQRTKKGYSEFKDRTLEAPMQQVGNWYLGYGVQSVHEEHWWMILTFGLGKKV